MAVNLLDLDAQGLAAFFAEIGEKPFRARQALRWLHQVRESDFDRMTDLSKTLRERLKQTAAVEFPKLVAESAAADGTRKWLLSVGGGNAIEAVFIPEANRGTLCVSSQVGCALECAFCSTGRQGFNRNLSTAEIIGQLWWATRALGEAPRSARLSAEEPTERPISNVVMMGMGEPLANFDNVVRAKGAQRLPVVLTRAEVRAVIQQLQGTPRLMVLLMYGAGSASWSAPGYGSRTSTSRPTRSWSVGARVTRIGSPCSPAS